MVRVIRMQDIAPGIALATEAEIKTGFAPVQESTYCLRNVSN